MIWFYQIMQRLFWYLTVFRIFFTAVEKYFIFFWFAEQIKWLVSIWWGTLVIIGLNIYTKNSSLYINKNYNQYAIPLASNYSIKFTHCKPMFQFYTPWKHQKTRGFLMFPGGIEMKYWLKWVNAMLLLHSSYQYKR